MRFRYLILIPVLLFIVAAVHANPVVDWQAQIDSIWGVGAPTQEKLAVFDSVHTMVQEMYAGYPNLPVNWDSLAMDYRTEISQGVSKGRFAAILNYLSMRLYDGHSRFYHPEINMTFKGTPDIPLAYVGNWGRETRFGAALTPMPDSSLLVYQVVPNHPLGLQPGDRILGYDGVPWTRLVARIQEAELPVAEFGEASLFAGNKTSLTDGWLSGAGRNWHLFDTIDVLPYGSSDTLHFPTDLLADISGELLGTEQLPISGVARPDTGRQDPLSWGRISETNIGYIYSWSWYGNTTGTEFFHAIDSLTAVYGVDGIILDMRYNHGGYVDRSRRGLSLLFQDSLPKMGLAVRDNPADHMSLQHQWHFTFRDQDTTASYGGPIAVLVGPKTASAAEFITLWFSSQPQVRIFGKPSNGSMAGASSRSFGSESWIAIYAHYNGVVDEEPVRYLAHQSIQVDEAVWLTPQSVVQGRDNVVDTAVDWIEEETTIDDSPAIPVSMSLAQNYPNPFNAQTTFRFTLEKQQQIRLTVYDLQGRLVTVIDEAVYAKGVHEINWNATDLASGVYFYALQTQKKRLVKKLVLVR